MTTTTKADEELGYLGLIERKLILAALLCPEARRMLDLFEAAGMIYTPDTVESWRSAFGWLCDTGWFKGDARGFEVSVTDEEREWFESRARKIKKRNGLEVFATEYGAQITASAARKSEEMRERAKRKERQGDGA